MAQSHTELRLEPRGITIQARLLNICQAYWVHVDDDDDDDDDDGDDDDDADEHAEDGEDDAVAAAS